MARSPTKGPEFVRYFGPVLDALRTLGNSGTPSEVVERVAKDQKISEEVLTQLNVSGQSRFYNEVHWARFYLMRAGLIDGSERGVWRLTERGRNEHFSREKAVELFKKLHNDMKAVSETGDQASTTNASAKATPEEIIAPEQSIITDHRKRLAQILKNMSATGFEHFSALLLRRAGFTEVNVTGRTNDGGIDGIGYLRINPMMTSRVLFQCKRYTSSAVPKDDIMKFQAAVMRERAEKGLFLTTSIFTRGAREEAVGGACEIELIDIDRLVELMELLELGLSEKKAYVVDEDFFAEFISTN